MKRSQIINIPLISLSDGSYIGKIKEVLIDFLEKKVMGFVIKEKSLFKPNNKYLLIEDIKTIGDYACTINGEDAIKSAADIGIDQHTDNYYLINKKIITSSGSFLGRISDFSFDIASGKLTGIHLNNQEYNLFNYLLPMDKITTLGKDVVITIPDINIPKVPPQNMAQRNMEQEKPYDKTGPQPPYSKIYSATREASKTLEEKAIDFAMGKQVFKTVEDGQGGVIINKGERIKPEVIDLARERSKLPHLLFAAGINEILEGLDCTKEKVDQRSKQLLDQWKQLREDSKKEKETGKNITTSGKVTRNPGLENNIYPYWQNRLARSFSEIDFDYRTMTNLKQQLENTKPTVRVMNERGEILKEKGNSITRENLQNINKPDNLVSLLAAVTAGDIESYLHSIESRLLNTVNPKQKSYSEPSLD